MTEDPYQPPQEEKQIRLSRGAAVMVVVLFLVLGAPCGYLAWSIVVDVVRLMTIGPFD